VLAHVLYRETVSGSVVSARGFRRRERTIVIAPRHPAVTRDIHRTEADAGEYRGRTWGQADPVVRRSGPDRPRPRLSFQPDECNPFKLFNLYGLGHWSEFSWARLLSASRQ